MKVAETAVWAESAVGRPHGNGTAKEFRPAWRVLRKAETGTGCVCRGIGFGSSVLCTFLGVVLSIVAAGILLAGWCEISPFVLE